MKYKLHLIALLVKYQIVKWSFKRPLTFKSGIKAPIYFNFRETGTFLDLFTHICNGFVERFENKGFEGVVGVATGAIQYAANVGPRLNIPFGYVRPEPKGHGLEKQIDGLDVSGKKILLIEDLVTTASSVLKAAKVLIDAGAKEVEITSVFTYRMPVSESELKKAGYELQSLIDINDVLPALDGHLSGDEFISLTEWIKNPSSWFEKYKTTFDFGYLTALRCSARDHESLVSFGIDPVIAAIPGGYSKNIIGYGDYMEDLFSEMNNRNLLPSIIKTNLGFYEIHDRKRSGGTDGTKTLSRILDMAEKYNIPTTLDAKTGDIGKSSANYADLCLNNWGAMATTVAPYMGDDSIAPYAAYCNAIKKKGIYVLTCTSNSGASRIQTAELRKNGFVYNGVIEMLLEFSKKCPGVGAVVGATHPEQASRIAKDLAGKDIPVILPGFGDQGGSVSQIIPVFRNSGYEMELLGAANSSKLTHAWYKNEKSLIPDKNEAIEISINNFKEFNSEINNYAFM